MQFEKDGQLRVAAVPRFRSFRKPRAPVNRGTPVESTVLIVVNVVGDAGLGKLILATASVLVIEFGATAIGHAGDVRELALNSSWEGPASSGSSQHPQLVANLSKDDIRQAQLELRHAGLYSGSLDGVIGPQTKQALVQLQKDNGLEQTGTLDGRTMVMMFGNIGTSEGSSMPANASQATGQ
jgi:hypothetical protein